MSNTNSLKIKEDRSQMAMLRAILDTDMAVRVGVLSSPQGTDMGSPLKAQAAKKERGPKGRGIVNSKDADIVDIAMIHEFGSHKANIPARSFLRSTAEDPKTIIRVEALIKRAFKKDESLSKIMEIIGVGLVSQVKRTFRHNDWDALKDPTRGGKNKKGQARPLIDTGQLRASIGYVVEKDNRGAS